MEKQERSITIDQLDVVRDWLRAIDEIDQTYLYDGSITIMDGSSNPFAEIWWDSESETWRVDWDKE